MRRRGLAQEHVQQYRGERVAIVRVKWWRQTVIKRHAEPTPLPMCRGRGAV